MKYNTIETLIEDKIGWITLNRPEENNTFNIPLATELNSALREMDENEDVNVVVVNANGKNFCTGIDVNYVDGKSMQEYLDWGALMGEMNITIAEMVKPVIASVQGIAVANGIGLVAGCDLAIAADTARFGATAVNIGLFCMGPAVPLLKSIGRKRTLDLIMTGDIIDAEKALDFGIVNRLVPEDDLVEETKEYARKLADKNPAALQIGKKSFYQIEDMNYKDAIEYANYHFATLCTLDEAQADVDKFLKRS